MSRRRRGTLCVGMTGDDKPFTYLDKTTQQSSAMALKAFVDQVLHISMEDGSCKILA